MNLSQKEKQFIRVEFWFQSTFYDIIAPYWQTNELTWIYKHEDVTIFIQKTNNEFFALLFNNHLLTLKHVPGVDLHFLTKAHPCFNIYSHPASYPWTKQ